MGFLNWLKRSGNQEKVIPIELTDANFDGLLASSELPALVDVWSPTCAPCAKLAPVMSSLAKKHAGRVQVFHVNAAEAPRLMQRLHVSGTPTVVVMHKGREKGRVVGYRPRSWFDQMIETEFPTTEN